MHTQIPPDVRGHQVKDVHPAFIEAPETRERLYRAAREAVEGGTTDVFFVGAGGSLSASWPACLALQERATRLHAHHLQSDEFNHRPPRRLGPTSLVVVSSHTGATPETVRAIATAREAGVGRVLGFTRDAATPLGDAVDEVFAYGATKTAWGAKGVLMAHLAHGLLQAAGEDPDDRELVLAAYDALPGALVDALAELEPLTGSIAAALADEPITYVLGAGPLQSVAYGLAMCYMQEMQWMHAASFNAGEFFHGAFEVITEDVPVLVLAGEDATRPMADRAVSFLERYTRKLHVVDSRRLALPGIPDVMRAEIATLAMDAFITRLAQHLEAVREHDLTTRRYMFTVEY